MCQRKEPRAGSGRHEKETELRVCVFSEKMLHSALAVSVGRHPGGDAQQISLKL